MKKLLLIISILTFTTISHARIPEVVSQCRHYEGAEFVRIGWLATSALRLAVRLSENDDPDAQQALLILKGLRSFSVFEYEDCSEADKAAITRKIERALKDSEVLLEAGDAGDNVRIYGNVDTKGNKVRDLVLFTPSDYSLICVVGTISMDAIAELAAND